MGDRDSAKIDQMSEKISDASRRLLAGLVLSPDSEEWPDASRQSPKGATVQLTKVQDALFGSGYLHVGAPRCVAELRPYERRDSGSSDFCVVSLQGAL